MKIVNHKMRRNEKGQVLVLVLILLLVGSLIIAPLLAFMGTGLKAGTTHEKKMDELYAADAGINDGMWQIKNDKLATKFAAYTPPYDLYDYYDNSGASWAYPLAEMVNNHNVNVTIKNMWIPKDLTPPNKTDARTIIEGSGGNPPKLTVAGVVVNVPTVSTPGSYRIKIDYYPTVGENLTISALGIWLPPGFTYVAGSSNLESNPSNPYYSVPVTNNWCSGQAVVWSFNSVPFSSFPGVNPSGSPRESTITFQFNGAAGQRPAAVAWINTNLNLSGGITYAWDADKKVYQITSTAGNTTIDAYTIKVSLRQMASAIAGDYVAIGNSLLIDDTPPLDGKYRNKLLSSSNATASSLSTDANVELAYLYWSGWYKQATTTTPFTDSCDNFNQWDSGSTWNISSGRFRSHYSSGDESTRYLTMKSNVNLSGAPSGSTKVQWTQSESGQLESNDRLLFSFSADGGITWSDNGLPANMFEAFRDDNPPSSFSYTIPDQYLTSQFRLRFYLMGFADSDFWGTEYCYLDDIKISYTVLTADTTATFRIDYRDSNNVPQQYSQTLTADPTNGLDRVQTMLNEGGPDYSYSCRKDVTDLVRSYSGGANPGATPPVNGNGNATYTAGDVGATANANDEWAYAGWSLVIIYSSSETLGHQLYLYDDFVYSGMDRNVDFDGDGQPGGTISGFFVPEPVTGENVSAKMTCFVGEGDDIYDGDYIAIKRLDGTKFTKLWDGITTGGNSQASPNDVWNSKSLGMSADGVDVDTFYVFWGNPPSNGVLQPGDTSVKIDMYTQTDSWNLVYIIISFRSQTTTGGTVTYLIR